MSRVLMIAAAAAATSIPETASANEPVAPTGQWVIDFAEHQCTASQQFGTKDDPALLVLRPSLGGDVLQLAMIGKGNQEVGEESAQLQLSDGRHIKVRELRYGAGSKAYRLINLDKGEQADLSKTTLLDWKQGKRRTILKVPALAQVLAKLDECRQDLRRHWNIDSPAPMQRVAAAEKPMIEYFKSSDYPRLAMSDDKQGKTGFVLLIDEQGAMRDCMVEQTSGVPVLDTMACLVLRERARFVPALDASGKPVRGTIRTTVNWRLGGPNFILPIIPVRPTIPR